MVHQHKQVFRLLHEGNLQKWSTTNAHTTRYIYSLKSLPLCKWILCYWFFPKLMNKPTFDAAFIVFCFFVFYKEWMTISTINIVLLLESWYYAFPFLFSSNACFEPKKEDKKSRIRNHIPRRKTIWIPSKRIDFLLTLLIIFFMGQFWGIHNYVRH